MIGPYYRPQLTSVLSIANRLTGIWLTVVTAPLLIVWLGALASGPEAFQAMRAFLGGLIGQALVLSSLFSLAYHLLNGIRHLVWDTGRGLEMNQVRSSGWLMLAGSVLLTMAVWMAGS